MAITINGSGTVTGISVGGLPDGIVDDGTLATDAVTAVKIADNAVDLAEMASGTDGQIITYDASGNPTAVGPGTDGQVLTSTGAGSPPAFEAVAASDNTPSFRAYMTAGQSFANGVYVKLTLNATSWDTDSAFDTSNYRFTVPTGKAGKYHFDARWISATVSSNPTYHIVPYKNGGALSGGHHSTGIRGVSGRSSYSLIDVFTLNLSVGDYVEFYALFDDSVSSALANEYQTYLEGFRLAGV